MYQNKWIQFFWNFLKSHCISSSRFIFQTQFIHLFVYQFRIFLKHRQYAGNFPRLHCILTISGPASASLWTPSSNTTPSINSLINKRAVTVFLLSFFFPKQQHPWIYLLDNSESFDTYLNCLFKSHVHRSFAHLVVFSLLSFLNYAILKSESYTLVSYLSP